MNSRPEWLTWPEAAEVVGCPVPTIDWYTRQGRIKTRPHQGNRPSVNRKSAEEFAEWWQQRQAERERRRAAEERRQAEALAPPEPTGWIRTDEAAEVLGVTPHHVTLLARQGKLRSERRGRIVWLEESSVRTLVKQRHRWVSMRTAARMVGCSERTIGRALKAGQIKQRSMETPAIASLDRKSVEAFGRKWRSAADGA